MHKYFENRPYQFKHPCSIIISGQTLSGKTTLVKQILEQLDTVFSSPIQNVVISYVEEQSIYSDMKAIDPRIATQSNLDIESFSNSLIVVDDQMNDAMKEKKIQELFTRGVHHKNNSLILITQNLYPQGKYARDIRLNAHYQIILKSPTFLSQVMNLGRTLFPKKPSFLYEAYISATETPYSYVFVNAHPECEEDIRVRSCILSKSEEIIYTPT